MPFNKVDGQTLYADDLDNITPEFHIADYGTLDPTGASSSHAALLAALEAADAAGGGTVKVPVGYYRIDDSLPLFDNVVLQGSGKYASAIYSPTLAAPFLVSTDTAYSAVTGDRRFYGAVEQIGFIGNATPVANSIAIDLTQCTSWAVRDCRVFGFDLGVHVASVAYYNHLEGIVTSGCNQGYLIENVANDNVFVNCRALGGATGFECRDGADGGLNNVQFYGCGAESWTSYGLHINSASGGLIDSIKWYGGRLECNAGVAIQTTGTSGNVRWCQFMHPYISGSTTVLTDSAFSSSFPNTLDRGGGRSRGVLVADPTGSSIGLVYFSNANSRVNVRNSADSAYRGIGCGTVVINSGFELQVPRVRVGNATALVAGNFALSAGWGNTASVGSISGTDALHRYTVTSAGTGQAANPTITLTYTNGAHGAAPKPIVFRSGGSQLTVASTITTTSTTTYVLQFNGTPVAAETYEFTVQCLSN